MEPDPERDNPEPELYGAELADLFGSKIPNFQKRMVQEIIGGLFPSVWKSDAEAQAAMQAALAAVSGIAPTNELESMLAVQMVSAHNGAVECLRRAMLPDQTLDGRDVNLKHAAKLMSLYTQQVAALDKHRGGGRQKITVEHVTVEAGGQAIVGNVNHGSGSKRKRAEAPQAGIVHNSDAPLDISTPRADQADGEKIRTSRSSATTKSGKRS
jgi:hypothetical protein